MARYIGRSRVIDVTIAAPANMAIAEILAGSTDWPLITYFGLRLHQQAGVSAASPIVGFGIPTTVGVAKAGQRPLLPLNPNSPIPPVTITTEWTTEPVQPTNYLRRMSLFVPGTPTLLEGGIRFQRGLQLKPGVSLACWFLAAFTNPAVMEAYVELDQ